MQVTRIQTATGMLVSNESYSEQIDFDLNQQDGTFCLDGWSDLQADYYDGTEIVPRPTFTPSADKESIKADGVEVITISGLPSAMNEFRLDGPAYDAWEQMGDVQLTVNLPGTYTLRISQWPYQDAGVTFNAS